MARRAVACRLAFAGLTVAGLLARGTTGALAWEPVDYYDSMEYFEGESGHEVVYEFTSPVLAKETHDHALARANTGALGEALGLFLKAVQQDPTVEVFWSNLGVTQMRLGLLDEALASFNHALEITPESSLVMDNVDALKEHLAHRAEQTGVPAPIPVDKPQQQPRQQQPQQPKQQQQQQQQKRRKRKKANKPDEVGAVVAEVDGPSANAVPDAGPPRTTAEQLEDWLGPWWRERDRLGPQLAFALQNYRPFQIRHFLQRDKALALHRELWASPHYRLYESYERWYQYHFKAIYRHNERFEDHKLLSQLAGLFDSPDMREWIRDLSGSEVNGSTIAGASWYQPGDYTMCHTDKATGADGVAKRRVAFILHLTTKWQPGYGGDLVFMNPTYHIHPSFNSITLFPVSRTSWHFVSPVAPVTPPNFKRLAFSGWWTTTNIAEATAIEERVSDDVERNQFATCVDGRNGQIMDNTSAYEKMEELWIA